MKGGCFGHDTQFFCDGVIIQPLGQQAQDVPFAFGQAVPFSAGVLPPAGVPALDRKGTWPLTSPGSERLRFLKKI